jgi:hypothetical protein
MGNYNIEEERLKPPFLYGVGKVEEVVYGSVAYMLKSNTEFITNYKICGALISHYNDLGNSIVCDFDRGNKEETELDFTFLEPDDFIALRHNADYENIESIRISIDNLDGSYFPKKKNVDANMTLIVDDYDSELTNFGKYISYVDFIKNNKGIFSSVKFVGFRPMMENALSRYSEKHGLIVENSLEKGRTKKLSR